MTVLSSVAYALRDDPRFVAGRLALLPAEAWDAFPAELRLNPDALDALLCCRWPAVASFGDHVDAIARLSGTDPRLLAREMRTADAIIAISAVGDPVTLGGADTQDAGMLAAAHYAEQQLPLAGRPGPTGTPADRLRQTGPQGWERSVRSLAAHVQRILPLAVVEMTGGSLHWVRRWLRARGVRSTAAADRPLSGLLVAWRGQGLVFIDRTLPEDSKHLVLAHEIGHFMLDHLTPRNQILDEHPSFVEVYDGIRAATQMERFIESVYELPIRPLAHSLYRAPDGSPTDEVADSEDHATLFALDLLCPWDQGMAVADVVLHRASHGPAAELNRAALRQQLAVELRKSFGLADAAAGLRAEQLMAGLWPRGPFDE